MENMATSAETENWRSRIYFRGVYILFILAGAYLVNLILVSCQLVAVEFYYFNFLPINCRGV